MKEPDSLYYLESTCLHQKTVKLKLLVSSHSAFSHADVVPELRRPTAYLLFLQVFQ